MILRAICGTPIQIDDSDEAMLSKHRWYIFEKRTVKYAKTSLVRGGVRKNVPMHRLILGLDKSTPPVDHADKDGLNNRRANLRICTPSQNLANRAVANRTGFRGVYVRGRRFVAQITLGHGALVRENDPRRMRHLGFFRKAEDAARAYDAAAIEMFGEFATLNFPSEAA